MVGECELFLIALHEFKECYADGLSEIGDYRTVLLDVSLHLCLKFLIQRDEYFGLCHWSFLLYEYMKYIR